ncbi:hypothetical protein AB0J83_35920 [Actinoplanes sp. NPDC049596]|uniref:hypothetical protein n=1 Tax=unclassified Actinoplanes TaxID=2626549 RepID=UPI00344283A8
MTGAAAPAATTGGTAVATLVGGAEAGAAPGPSPSRAAAVATGRAGNVSAAAGVSDISDPSPFTTAR